MDTGVNIATSDTPQGTLAWTMLFPDLGAVYSIGEFENTKASINNYQ